MQESHLILFAVSRPFEPFRIYVADGRTLEVRHPEMVMVAEYGLSVWIFCEQGQIEAVDGNLITGLRTLGSVDPEEFAGVRVEE